MIFSDRKTVGENICRIQWMRNGNAVFVKKEQCLFSSMVFLPVEYEKWKAKYQYKIKVNAEETLKIQDELNCKELAITI